MDVMEGELARIEARQRGFVTRGQALDCGYTDDQIRELVRHKAWTRLRRGSYARTSTLVGKGDSARHALLVRCVMHSLVGRPVVAGYSALAVLGVPLWGVRAGQVHVHREPGRSARTEAGVSHHVGDLPDHEITEVDGLLVAVPERAMVDAARDIPFEQGVVLSDGARRLLAADLDQAMEILERQRDWPGSIHAHRALDFSDPRAATVGESRGRVAIARIGLPKPELQYRIDSSSGRLLGISDFYFDGMATAAEFDGRLKYGRALYERDGRLDEGIDLGEVVWQEKRREDAIRDAGHEMVRFIWSELDGHDGALRARFLRAFARGSHPGRGRAS